jgi:hypothetical protein
MDEELKQHLIGMEQRLDQRITQRCEEAERKLLSAFYGWARIMESRSRGTSVVVNGLDERLSHLEDRVSQS